MSNSIKSYHVDATGVCLESIIGMFTDNQDKHFLTLHKGGRVYMQVSGGWRYYSNYADIRFKFIAEDELPKPFKMQLLMESV